MINGLVLFAKTGGSTFALGDIVRPVAYHEIRKAYRNRVLYKGGEGKIGNTPCASKFEDLLSDYPISVDIIHGSLPTEAEYARIVRRELGEESGNLYEQIYELAKEIQPKFLFFEIQASRRRSSYILDLWGRRLSSLGYDCRWDTLSAYDVGSPQKRERVYLLVRKREGVDGNVSSKREGYNTSLDSKREPHDFIGYGGTVERTPERVAEVKAGLAETCVPQYREAFLRLSGIKGGG